jgi:UPF0755 protein
MFLQKDKKKEKLNIFQKIFVIVIFLVASAFVFLFAIVSPPIDFPKGEVVEIEKGKNLSQISNNLKERKVIKVSRVLDAVVILLDKEKDIVAGEYSFERPMSVFEIAYRITRGIHGIDTVRIKIPEGATLEEIADIYEQNLTNFNKEEFFVLTRDMEGYLFPDTYIFFKTTKTSDVVDKMLENFDRRVAPYLVDIEKSGKTLKDIVIMASIIQKEAYSNYREKQIISGILWRRMDINMRLQVDATLKYITGKPSSRLTRADLAMDHDYNTYRIYGLPPGAIGAPSLNAIRAAIDPEKSPYLYYLHDNSGQVHYGVTHNDHVNNKNRYLR